MGLLGLFLIFLALGGGGSFFGGSTSYRGNTSYPNNMYYDGSRGSSPQYPNNKWRGGL